MSASVGYDLASDWKHLTMAMVAMIFSSYLLWRIMFRARQIDSDIPIVSGRLPYFGHWLELIRSPITFINRCKAEQGSVFRINLIGLEVYVLTGTLIQEMLHTPRAFNTFEAILTLLPVERVLRISYGLDPTVQQAKRDKNPVASLVKQNFKPSQIASFSRRVQQGLSHVLNDKLNLKPGEKKLVELEEFVTSITSRISCLCFVGSNVGGDERVVKSAASFIRKMTKAGIVDLAFPDWIARRVIKRYYSVDQENNTCMALLVPELVKLRDGKISHEDEPTFISALLNTPKSDGTLRTPEETASFFLGSVFAALHTTAQFVAFALTELQYHPALVEVLRTEIEKLDERTPETVNQIKLLDSFVREVFRCNAPALASPHKATQDAVLSTGKVVPRGSLVVGTTYDAHTDPALMPETVSSSEKVSLPLDQFDPYRFTHTGENDEHIRSTSIGPELLTFGLGGHACPGRFLAANEIKYVVAEVVMRYNIISKPERSRKTFEFVGLFRFLSAEKLLLEGRG